MAAEGAPAVVHLPELRAAGETLVLAGDEAHYLGRVVRVRAGERVTASDGRGLLATLVIDAVGPSITARVETRRDVARGATLEVWAGAPEGERGDWLVEKLAELGVAALRPVHCARGAWERVEARRERWERLVVAALRQSRAAWRMELLPPIRLAEALPAAAPAGARWLCHPEGRAFVRPAGFGGRAIGLVGPSSGFDDVELKTLEQHGFERIALAGDRLRSETAAMALAALWAGASPESPH